MRRTRLALGSLTACTALLAAGAPAFAQQPVVAQQGDRQGRNRDQDRRDQQEGRNQDQETRSRDQAQNRDRQGRRQAGSDQERQEAVRHFLAGYYAGYTDGWVDGSDELVIGIIDRQRRQAQEQVAAGRDPAKMQDGRRAVRERMRDRMRGESRGTRSGSRGVPTVSLSGEVLAAKLVPIRNSDIEHRVVRIETQDGRSRIVDLGPTDQTERLDVQTGDTIQVRGTPVMAGDFRILAAREVRAGDRTVRIEYERLNLGGRQDVSARDRDRQGESGRNSGSRSRNQRNRQGGNR